MSLADKKEPIKILLLTNRDSDNVGDQVIEACDIALLSAVMENLLKEKPVSAKAALKNYAMILMGKKKPVTDTLSASRYEISSRAASIVTQKYLKKPDPALLESAEKAIAESDIVVFGGAPVFNYLYQNFYERTAVTLELAEKHNKPVIFSAIGVEAYSEKSKKSQRLKKTLNLPCVKQITTRDDYDYLTEYKDKEDLVIGKVCDPAVYTDVVFRNFTNVKKRKKKKKIGLFILRANGFVDNKVDFSRDRAERFWVELIEKIKEKGYAYELITSGHFGDEAFLDRLIRECGIPESKCVFNINCPEQLIEKIAGYNGIVSCRLHPSIISFALSVPAVGLVWNNKVRRFYESIGYEDRFITVEDFQPDKVLERLEKTMDEGVSKDKEYLYTIYKSLFDGLGRIIYDDEQAIPQPYSYEELINLIPAFEGTPEKEKLAKLQRKFRRAYNSFNTRFEKNEELKEEVAKLKNAKQ